MSNEENYRANKTSQVEFVHQQELQKLVSAAPGCQFARDGYGGLVVYQILLQTPDTMETGSETTFNKQTRLNPTRLKPQCF